MLDPKSLRFQKSHEWLSPDGTVGISDHAQKEITDVVFFEPPKVGRMVKQGEACCVVESVKAAFDIYAPVSGEIVAANAEASKNPAILNSEPYGKGWLFKIKASMPRESDVLMNAGDYEKFLASEAVHGSH